MSHCACRIITERHPCGNGWAEESRIEVCDVCAMAQIDAEADDALETEELLRLADLEASQPEPEKVAA